MNAKAHYFDGAGICIHCDQCQDIECCPDAENEACDGQNWAFLTNGSIERFAREIMKQRKANKEI